MRNRSPESAGEEWSSGPRGGGRRAPLDDGPLVVFVLVPWCRRPRAPRPPRRSLCLPAVPLPPYCSPRPLSPLSSATPPLSLSRESLGGAPPSGRCAFVCARAVVACPAPRPSRSDTLPAERRRTWPPTGNTGGRAGGRPRFFASGAHAGRAHTHSRARPAALATAAGSRVCPHAHAHKSLCLCNQTTDSFCRVPTLQTYQLFFSLLRHPANKTFQFLPIVQCI